MQQAMEIEASQAEWLNEVKAAMLLCDPVDALNDAEALLTFAQGRLAVLLDEYEKT